MKKHMLALKPKPPLVLKWTRRQGSAQIQNLIVIGAVSLASMGGTTALGIAMQGNVTGSSHANVAAVPPSAPPTLSSSSHAGATRVVAKAAEVAATASEAAGQVQRRYPNAWARGSTYAKDVLAVEDALTRQQVRISPLSSLQEGTFYVPGADAATTSFIYRVLHSFPDSVKNADLTANALLTPSKDAHPATQLISYVLNKQRGQVVPVGGAGRPWIAEAFDTFALDDPANTARIVADYREDFRLQGADGLGVANWNALVEEAYKLAGRPVTPARAYPAPDASRPGHIFRHSYTDADGNVVGTWQWRGLQLETDGRIYADSPIRAFSKTRAQGKGYFMNLLQLVKKSRDATDGEVGPNLFAFGDIEAITVNTIRRLANRGGTDFDRAVDELSRPGSNWDSLRRWDASAVGPEHEKIKSELVRLYDALTLEGGRDLRKTAYVDANAKDAISADRIRLAKRTDAIYELVNGGLEESVARQRLPELNELLPPAPPTGLVARAKSWFKGADNWFVRQVSRWAGF